MKNAVSLYVNFVHKYFVVKNDPQSKANLILLFNKLYSDYVAFNVFAEL